MARHLDIFFERLNSGITAGIGRNSGRGCSHSLSLTAYRHVVFVTDEGEANRKLASDEFDEHLMFIRPELLDGSIKQKSEFSKLTSGIARYVKERAHSQFSGIHVDGLDNNPQGFSPSIVISTVELIYLTFAQELAAIENGYSDVTLFAHDLVSLLDLGYIPCGWDSHRKCGILSVF